MPQDPKYELLGLVLACNDYVHCVCLPIARYSFVSLLARKLLSSPKRKTIYCPDPLLFFKVKTEADYSGFSQSRY